jgi:hypothetical protein
MSTAYILSTLVATPFFASRAFLAAFVTAALARWGGGVPVVGGSTTLQTLAEAPAWFTHDATIAVLGLLAALEFAATKSPTARDVFRQFDVAIKAIVQAAVALAILPAADAALVPGVAQAGVGDLLWVLVATGLVVSMASVRAVFFRGLADLDPDDDLKVQSLLHWAEDGWVVFGLSLAAFAPVLALVLFAMTVTGLALVQKTVGWLDNRGDLPCPTCGHDNHPSAPHCSSCGATLAPMRVGLLGQALRRRVTGREAHSLDLVAARRCPHCAERLGYRALKQPCGACGTVTFASREDLDRYVGHLDRQLPMTAGVCLLFGLVPLIGIVPGVLYYRLTLVSGLSRWTPATRSVPARWAGRVVTVLLLMLQPVPLLGAITLPLICVANYLLYRKALTGTEDAVFA